ncbi:hypothetical protein ACFQJ7_07610 [Halovenus rubra]|uniref:Uncharacterized protein n=2 Tax=Halovenus rubra TaxID=869890 RepID=A0ACC7E2T8_9EURY|nr:hypothetical protein [Halovenus rubra]
MRRFGCVLAVVGIVVLAGCAGLSGVTEQETPHESTPERNATEQQTVVTPTQVSTVTPDPKPTSTPTPEWEKDAVASSIENPTKVAIKTYAHNRSEALVRATVTVYDGTGTQQQSFALNGSSKHTISNLEPGTNYTARITEIGWQDMPPVESSFDPGQTDMVEVFTLPNFQQTQKFKWKWRHIHHAYVNDKTLEMKNTSRLVEEREQIIGGGTYDNGDWVSELNLLWVIKSEKFTPVKTASIQNELQLRNWNGNWENAKRFAFNPKYKPAFDPVRGNLIGMESISLKYVDTQKLNDSTVPEPIQFHSIPKQNKGEKVHIFNISMRGYSEWADSDYVFGPRNQARIYVDVKTGHVLRWEARERLANKAGYFDKYQGMNPSIHIIDFYDHGNQSIGIDAEDFPSPKECRAVLTDKFSKPCRKID